MFNNDEKLYKIEPIKEIVLRCRKGRMVDNILKCDLIPGYIFFLFKNDLNIIDNNTGVENFISFSKNISFEVKLFFIKMYIKNHINGYISRGFKINSMIIHYDNGHFEFLVKDDIIIDIKYNRFHNEYLGEYCIKKLIYQGN